MMVEKSFLAKFQSIRQQIKELGGNMESSSLIHVYHKGEIGFNPKRPQYIRVQDALALFDSVPSDVVVTEKQKLTKMLESFPEVGNLTYREWMTAVHDWKDALVKEMLEKDK